MVGRFGSSVSVVKTKPNQTKPNRQDFMVLKIGFPSWFDFLG
jgi:hypothetical protein